MNIRGLRNEIRAAGLFEHREAETWAKFAALLTALASVMALQLLGGFWAVVGLMPLASFLATAAVMIGHEGGHHALSNNRVRNRLLLYVAFPLFSGLGASYWQWKHNQQHHAHPNVSGEDTDLQLWPMATSHAEHLRASWLQRRFQKHGQGLAFWPLTIFLPLSLRVKTLRFTVSRIRERGLELPLALDLAGLAGHLLLWLVLPSLVFGFVATVSYWLGLWAIVGVYLAMVFSPAHMGLPVFTSHPNPWQLQLEATRNFRLPRWLSFFFIGLDYQIEHHLFPKIPHQNLPATAAIVRTWAQREQLQYQEIGYGAALVDVTRFIRDAWSIPATTISDSEPADSGAIARD